MNNVIAGFFALGAGFIAIFVGYFFHWVIFPIINIIPEGTLRIILQGSAVIILFLGLLGAPLIAAFHAYKNDKYQFNNLPVNTKILAALHILGSIVMVILLRNWYLTFTSIIDNTLINIGIWFTLIIITILNMIILPYMKILESPS